MMEEKICFVIAPLGDPPSDIRKRSDQILEHVVIPVATEFGYKVIRADKISKPGNLQEQIEKYIRKASLVIVDLTDQNPNVFFELGIRHALGKSYIQIIEDGEEIPIDVANTRTIKINHKDLDSVKNAKMELRNQISNANIDTSENEVQANIILDTKQSFVLCFSIGTNQMPWINPNFHRLRIEFH